MLHASLSIYIHMKIAMCTAIQRVLSSSSALAIYMDFLALPPDVQLDWNAMMTQAEFFDTAPISPSVPMPEPYQVANNEQALLGPAGALTAREMAYRMAAMRPVQIDPETVRPRRRRNVRISKDPQSTAARHRRERISERIRILQRLVPGGTKMDTASMLDEAVQYLKFLKGQLGLMERNGFGRAGGGCGIVGFSSDPMQQILG